MKVARVCASVKLLAPTYVQVDRMPPRRSSTVAATGPLYGSMTVLPSEDL